MVILSSKHKTGEGELIVAILKPGEATRGETPFNCCVVSYAHQQNICNICRTILARLGLHDPHRLQLSLN